MQICTRYHAPRQVPNTTPVLYDDWLHLDLRNTSEDILWLHSVEVCIVTFSLPCVLSTQFRCLLVHIMHS